MASLNLLQWREQSVWQRYRTLHCLGIFLMLIISAFSVQWVMSYGDSLSHLKQRVAEQKLVLEKQKHRQQLWTAYQQKQKKQQAFAQLKRTDQRLLNAFYALLSQSHKNLRRRELSLSRSQLKLAAEYQQIQDVNEHYVWLEKQLPQPGLKQQLLPQHRVLFHYTSPQRGVKTSG